MSSVTIMQWTCTNHSLSRISSVEFVKGDGCLQVVWSVHCTIVTYYVYSPEHSEQDNITEHCNSKRLKDEVWCCSLAPGVHVDLGSGGCCWTSWGLRRGWGWSSGGGEVMAVGVEAVKEKRNENLTSTIINTLKKLPQNSLVTFKSDNPPRA